MTEKDFKWYIVNIYTSFEKKVKEDILMNAKRAKISEEIKEIYIPSEKKTKLSPSGKKIAFEKSAHPGYIYINCQLTDKLFSIIKNTNRVSNFLCGSNGKPVVISDKKIDEIKSISEASLAQEVKEDFQEGETVKINTGTFEGFNGIIKEVNKDASKLKIEVTIFGKPVEVDLSENGVKRILGDLENG